MPHRHELQPGQDRAHLCDMILFDAAATTNANGSRRSLYTTMPGPIAAISMFFRIALLPALLLAPFASPAQAQPPQSPPIHGLAHIAVRVADIATSRAFYERLGYQQAFAFEKNGTATQSFIKVNDRQFIELYPRTETQSTLGFLHLCFDGEDLNALHDFDIAQGLTPITVRKAGAGNLLFTLRGPEDQNIEYTQYMPGSLHYEDRGKHLGPAEGSNDSSARIADSFFAVGLGMKDPGAASTYYISKLGFSPIGGNANLLLIPGSKAPGATEETQQILIQPLTSPVSRIFFTVKDLGKTAAELKKRGIAFKSAKHELTVTDPDGNLLVFTTRKTAA
jgi:catechol 2,3-dioxygenase-like lactoylglutathione lyase family enzyme